MTTDGTHILCLILSKSVQLLTNMMFALYVSYMVSITLRYIPSWWPDGKECACNAGDQGSIPGLRGSLGEGTGNSFQYSCLKNPMTEEPGGIEFMGPQKVRLSD